VTKVPWVLEKKSYIKVILSCSSPVWGDMLWRKGVLSYKRAYETLHVLSKRGILKVVEGKNKKVYVLTEKGKEIRKHLVAIKNCLT